MADPEALKKVLLYHVIPAEIKSSDITEDDVSVASAEGTKLRVNTYMKRFYYDVSLLYSNTTSFARLFQKTMTIFKVNIKGQLNFESKFSCSHLSQNTNVMIF